MVVALRPKRVFKVPVEAECITPDTFAGKSVEEIGKFKVWEGNRERSLSELFSVKGESGAKPEEVSIQIRGDVHKVRRIGAQMSAGEIVVHGDVGFHLGEEMAGGRILVDGNADSWMGLMMKGGVIEVKGDAGDYVGAAYKGGSTKGMSGGTIEIHGNAGNELGYFMRKGIIKVHGDVGQFTGVHMRNGIIVVYGNSEGRDGAEMIRGKIVVCGSVPSVLPTFTVETVKAKVKINGEKLEGPFYLFTGDIAEEGTGKLYISKASNTHLKFYEEII
ncbi:MAG: formylmethanofuran dehydrogenase subunit C [Candidatus Bathyarchaeota archaeon]|jgi:formylmethanofuran dehydrogenase subunit C